MAYVKTIHPKAADGLLARIYKARTKAAGRLWEIVKVQGQSPETLRESMRMYSQIVLGASPVSRIQREMIAVRTSQLNECHY